MDFGILEAAGNTLFNLRIEMRDRNAAENPSDLSAFRDTRFHILGCRTKAICCLCHTNVKSVGASSTLKCYNFAGFLKQNAFGFVSARVNCNIVFHLACSSVFRFFSNLIR